MQGGHSFDRITGAASLAVAPSPVESVSQVRRKGEDDNETTPCPATAKRLTSPYPAQVAVWDEVKLALLDLQGTGALTQYPDPRGTEDGRPRLTSPSLRA